MLREPRHLRPVQVGGRAHVLIAHSEPHVPHRVPLSSSCVIDLAEVHPPPGIEFGPAAGLKSTLWQENSGRYRIGVYYRLQSTVTVGLMYPNGENVTGEQL